MSDRDYRDTTEVLKGIESALGRIATALEDLLARQEAREEREREGR